MIIPSIPIIVLSAIDDAKFVSDIFKREVRGYIPLQNTPVGLTVEIIRLVKAGGTFVPLSSLQLHNIQIDKESAGMSASRDLTMRERTVLKLLKQGKANKTIAHELQLSENTVKAHIHNIMRKMKVKNRTEVVCHAYATNPRAVSTS